MILLASKFKMIGVLLNVLQVRSKKCKKTYSITKESKGVSEPFKLDNYAFNVPKSLLSRRYAH